MDPTQHSAGASDSVAIKSEIDGSTKITINDTRAMHIGDEKGLIAYNGTVRSGTEGSKAVEAYIFAFRYQGSMDETAKKLHEHCTIFDHPSVMRSLGYGRGSRDCSDYMFLAFPKFDCTFSDLLKKSSAAAEMGRFSEVFIQIVSDVVTGLEALHKHGFICPNLDGPHIAITNKNNSVRAKIWNFSACTNDNMKDKDMGWAQLGRMLLQAANNNSAGGPDSLEIQDLCRKMIDGKLQGLEILGHSALLPVLQKFEKVVFLWAHVSVHFIKPNLIDQEDVQSNEPQQKSNVQSNEPQQKSKSDAKRKSPKIVYTLEEYLDLRNIKSSRPAWIETIRGKRSATPRTFRALLDEIRDIIEHEIQYIPPDIKKGLTYKEKEMGKKAADLEHSIRKSWPEDFLRIQLWASNQEAKL